MCLRNSASALRCLGVPLGLLVLLGTAGSVIAAPVRLTIYDVAQRKATGYGTEFGQSFRSPCDASLVSVSVTDRSEARRHEPARVAISVHEGDRFADRIGPQQMVIIDGDHATVTAEWKPGEVPLRAGHSYYLRLVGDRIWNPDLHKETHGHHACRSGCAFADDGIVVGALPDHDLAPTIVVEAEPGQAVVSGEADARRVINGGASDLWVIGLGGGHDAAVMVDQSPSLMILGQDETTPITSSAVAWFDGSRNLLPNGNFEFGFSYWRRYPDVPVIHGTDVTVGRSERSRLRDKSTYRVWLPEQCPAGMTVCVSSSPVPVKPNTKYYLGGVYRSGIGRGVDAVLNVVEASSEGLTRERTLMRIGRHAAWQTIAQGFRTGPLTKEITVKFTLRAAESAGGEVLWDALYLVTADDLRVARAGRGDAEVPEPAPGPLAQGLNAVRAGDMAMAARVLTQVLTESPASPEARQAMHHLLDPWATEADVERAWAAWRRAILGTCSMPPPENGDREAALAHLRMGYVLAACPIAQEERLAECFQRAMVCAHGGLLSLEAAESARRCCQEEEKGLRVLAEWCADQTLCRTWTSFLAAIYAKNRNDRDAAIAHLWAVHEQGVRPGLDALALMLGEMLDREKHHWEESNRRWHDTAFSLLVGDTDRARIEPGAELVHTMRRNEANLMSALVIIGLFPGELRTHAGGCRRVMDYGPGLAPETTQEVCSSFAFALAKVGRQDLYCQWMREAIRAYPDSWRASYYRLQLGLNLEALGEVAEARQVYRELIAACPDPETNQYASRAKDRLKVLGD